MWFWFWLHGSGWAEAGIGDEAAHANAHANLTALYLSDALGDHLHAVWQCGSGVPEARCSWQEEPGEYRWILRRNGDQIRIQILEFDDVYQHRPDEAGSLLFETWQDWSTLAHAITLGASQTLEKHGQSAYEAQWGHPFPSATLALIRARLLQGREPSRSGDMGGHWGRGSVVRGHRRPSPMNSPVRPKSGRSPFRCMSRQSAVACNRQQIRLAAR